MMKDFFIRSDNLLLEDTKRKKKLARNIVRGNIVLVSPEKDRWFYIKEVKPNKDDGYKTVTVYDANGFYKIFKSNEYVTYASSRLVSHKKII